MNMVAAGFGITVVPKSMEAFRAPNIVYRDLDPVDGFTVPLNVAFRSQSVTDSMKRFLNICTGVAARP
jgi:hypothetical protein